MYQIANLAQSLKAKRTDIQEAATVLGFPADTVTFNEAQRSRLLEANAVRKELGITSLADAARKLMGRSQAVNTEQKVIGNEEAAPAQSQSIELIKEQYANRNTQMARYMAVAIHADLAQKVDHQLGAIFDDPDFGHLVKSIYDKSEMSMTQHFVAALEDGSQGFFSLGYSEPAKLLSAAVENIAE